MRLGVVAGAGARSRLSFSASAHTKGNYMPSLDQIMRNAGLNLNQRNQILRDMNAVADDNDDGAKRPRTSEVHKSLAAAFPDLDAAAVVKHLAKHGYLFDDGIGSVSAAAVTESNFRLHKQIQAAAARLGFDYRIGEKVDPFELDRALAGKDITARMTLKNNLMRLGVLSAQD
jgi:hypothetical protein